MSRRLLLRVAALCLVAAAATAASASSRAATSFVRIAGVDLGGYPHVGLTVITSSRTRTAPSLTENGTPVAGLQAVNLGSAKSVVLAIDTSRSMAGRALAAATDAARVFVDHKPRADRISVVTFGRQAVSLTGFSTSSTDADAALRGLAANGPPGTALYEAVVTASHELARTSLPGRVVLLLTDGRDISSQASLADAIAAARKANVAVYTVGIVSHDFAPGPLRALARATGGGYRRAESVGVLRDVYRAVEGEFEHTWRLGYETTGRPGDRLSLRVTVGGSGGVGTTVRLPGSAATTGSGGGGSLPAVAYSSLGALVLDMLVGIVVLSATLLLLRAPARNWLKARLASHLGRPSRRRARRAERARVLAKLFRITESALAGRRQWGAIEKLLERGDVPLRAAEFVWASVGAGLLLGLVMAVAAAPALVILAALAAGGAVPYAVVSWRVRRRTKAFEDQLPEMLAAIAASLKAGHSFKHGLQAVADEAKPPAAAELNRVLTEAGLGRPLEQSLVEMADRMGSKNFSFAITAVTIQRQVGGSLAGLFDGIAETVRQRQQFGRRIRSLTATGRMSAYTLVAVPLFIASVISLLNPSYMQPLYHSHMGHLLIVLGLTMMIVGSTILRKIVSFRG